MIYGRTEPEQFEYTLYQIEIVPDECMYYRPDRYNKYMWKLFFEITMQTGAWKTSKFKFVREGKVGLKVCSHGQLCLNRSSGRYIPRKL